VTISSTQYAHIFDPQDDPGGSGTPSDCLRCSRPRKQFLVELFRRQQQCIILCQLIVIIEQFFLSGVRQLGCLVFFVILFFGDRPVRQA
jgi:hypothetical protein